MTVHGVKSTASQRRKNGEEGSQEGRGEEGRTEGHEEGREEAVVGSRLRRFNATPQRVPPRWRSSVGHAAAASLDRRPPAILRP